MIGVNIFSRHFPQQTNIEISISFKRKSRKGRIEIVTVHNEKKLTTGKLNVSTVDENFEFRNYWCQHWNFGTINTEVYLNGFQIMFDKIYISRPVSLRRSEDKQLNLQMRFYTKAECKVRHSLWVVAKHR